MIVMWIDMIALGIMLRLNLYNADKKKNKSGPVRASSEGTRGSGSRFFVSNSERMLSFFC